MSVVVRGMEMPENCTRCDYIGLNLAIGCPVISGTNGRATDCPLVALPDKHGDLIDRDEVRNAVLHHLGIKGEENLLPAEKSIFGNLIKAKAVIEAEDGT